MPMLLPTEPAAPANSNLSPRRRFLQQLSAMAAVSASSLVVSACKLSHAESLTAAMFAFQHGVASGDPLPDRVIIWTRVTPLAQIAQDSDSTVWVQWQVARERDMQNIVASGSVQTSQEQDFTVKVDVKGLAAGQEYFYRFALASDASVASVANSANSANADPAAAPRYSRTGRTKTLPARDVQQVKLAVFSCSNYPAGYFNVFADAARQGDLDAALHLGDYIYEYEADGYACEQAQKLGRVSQPESLLLDLADYRLRYAQYRSDADLQQLHAELPMICVWDDHEFADDTWKDGAGEHDSLTQGPFSRRRNAAMTAYHEWLPIRCNDAGETEKIYRAFEFGEILSLYMLDTRLVGRDQQLMYSSYCDDDGKLDVEKLKRDAHAQKRQMLGKEQFAWLQQQVKESTACWQVLGQQVLMARMEFPLPVAQGEVDRFAYAAACAQAASNAGLSVQQKAWLNAPRVPCYLDSWDGYQAERERVFGLMQRHHKNLVVLAGDTHNAWASDLQDQAGRAVGVEFATASVSSPGLECSYPKLPAEQVASCMQALIPNLRYAQTRHRGYMLITASKEELRCDFRFVDTVHSRQFQAFTARSLRVLPGVRKIADADLS